ncbi:MAG TPA: MarR family transcriptional regulator [Thermoanaerobaculia bacterium]
MATKRRRGVSAREYEQLAAFRYALRQFHSFSEEAARGAGLTPQQHQALLAIKGFPDRQKVTIGDLAERLQVRHHSAVGLVDRLTTQGLLERHVNLDDRRQVHVALTERGLAVLEQLAAAHRDEIQRIGPQLRRLLQEIGEPVEPE